MLELRAGKRESAYKIDGEVQARENKVIGASEAQLRDGFERAVRAFVGKETNLGELGLQKEVKLRVISRACKAIALERFANIPQSPKNRQPSSSIIQHRFLCETSQHLLTRSVFLIHYLTRFRRRF